MLGFLLPTQERQIIDQSKRETLKVITGVTAAAASGLSLAGGFADGTLTPAVPVTSDASDRGQIQIQVITGKYAQEDTVIFMNDTGADIVLSEFLPGHITQNNQMLDLNATLDNGALRIRSGYPLASKAARWKKLSLESSFSYLWCDSAVAAISDQLSSDPAATHTTGVITINAAVFNGRALLTAEHAASVYS